MPRVIINTAGTSILPGFFLNKENVILLDKAKNCDNARKKITQKANEFVAKRVEDAGKNIGKISAEINCLEKIKTKENDILFFMVTETVDGLLCGELVANFCRNYFNTEGKIIQVEGLQVNDARCFEEKGLNNFVDEVIKITKRYQGYEVILNTTGGFKAVVPYTTLLGLVFGIPIYYIFEKSNQVIKLPSAPLKFDLEILKSIEPVIEKIKNDYMGLDDFLIKTGMAYDEMDELSGAVVLEDGMVTLSPLGRLLYERYLYKEGYKVTFSEQTKKKLQSGKYNRNKFEQIFEKMKDTVHLTYKIHNEVKSKNVDCDCYKGGSTNERVFYYLKKNVIYICDIFLHDEYNRAINQEKILKKNYKFDE